MFPWTDCCVPAIILIFPPARGSTIRDENLCFPRTTSSARCQRQYSGRALFFLVFVRESYSPQSSARRPLARLQLRGVKEQLPLGVIYVSTHHTRDDAPPFPSPFLHLCDRVSLHQQKKSERWTDCFCRDAPRQPGKGLRPDGRRTRLKKAGLVVLEFYYFCYGCCSCSCCCCVGDGVGGGCYCGCDCCCTRYCHGGC